MEVSELENLIKQYSIAYYSGNPIVDDATFDSLVDKLRKLNPNSLVLNTGWGFEVNGDKVKHKYTHIGSLDKCKSYEEIPGRFKHKKIFLSPKLDGLSAVAYFRNGELVQGITRGNGEYGKDITDKLITILGCKYISDSTFTGAVRGELIISDGNWELLQDKYGKDNMIAPRNYAAGVINRKELSEDLKYIDLVVYKIVGQESGLIKSNRKEVLDWLQTNFKHAIPTCFLPELNNSSWDTYHEDIFKEFRKLGYGLDGLVLTDEYVPFDSNTNAYMWNEVAFKFASETVDTTVVSMEWSLSRTQRMVPVCVVKPVVLAGANIERATGNNAQMVKDLGLGVGAEVSITRSNEVIPKILEVINPSTQELPTECPICKSKLEWVGVDLKCTNYQCPNIALSDLQQWCECVGETDGLQWTLMKQYLDIYGVTSINQLYDKKEYILNDLGSRQLSITEQKIYTFFKKLYIEPVTIYRALLGLNIPRLGDKTCKLLAKEKDLILGYYSYLVDYSYGVYNDVTPYYNKFMEVVKDATTSSIWSNSTKFLNLRYLFEDARVKFDESTNNEPKKFIAVTGSLQTMKRKDFEKHIEKYGYELSSNLKKCEYLVTNDPTSGSTKNKQAQQYRIPIITEQDFLNTLK